MPTGPRSFHLVVSPLALVQRTIFCHAGPAAMAFAVKPVSEVPRLIAALAEADP